MNHVTFYIEDEVPTIPSATNSGSARVIAAVLFFGAATLLVLGLRLEPNLAGIGTHQQLGLAPCGFLMTSGLPCATCGMTTAFSYAVHGKLIAGLVAQPAGLVMALITAACAIISLWALFNGMSLAPLMRWLWRPATVWAWGAIVIGAWIYKSLTVFA